MKQILCFLLLSVQVFACFGNGIQIANISIVNNGPGNIQVKFDLSRENRWRVNVGPNNYDGSWVFFKYKRGGGNWTHLTMTGNNNVLSAGFEVYQTSDFSKAGQWFTAMIPTWANAGIVLEGGAFNLTNDDMAISKRQYFAPAVGTRVAGAAGHGVLYIR